MSEMIFTWLCRFKAAWQYAKAAEKKQELLGDNVVPIDAKIAGMALVNGLLNREAICTRCFNRYTPKQREFADRFRVRSILMVPDNAPDPMLCDYCFDVTAASFNRFSTNVGTSNCGPTNLALRRLIARD